MQAGAAMTFCRYDPDAPDDDPPDSDEHARSYGDYLDEANDEPRTLAEAQQALDVSLAVLMRARTMGEPKWAVRVWEAEVAWAEALVREMGG